MFVIVIVNPHTLDITYLYPDSLHRVIPGESAICGRAEEGYEMF